MRIAVFPGFILLFSSSSSLVLFDRGKKNGTTTTRIKTSSVSDFVSSNIERVKNIHWRFKSENEIRVNKLMISVPKHKILHNFTSFFNIYIYCVYFIVLFLLLMPPPMLLLLLLFCYYYYYCLKNFWAIVFASKVVF